MTKDHFVSYLRASSEKHRQSDLGLQEQREIVACYLKDSKHVIIKEIVEIESSKKNKRPRLEEAIKLCKVSGAILILASIDKLTKDINFLLNLGDSGIGFKVVDMPEVNRTAIRVMAIVAEQERKAHSKRIKDSLTTAKARGVQLGAYRNGKFVGRVGNAENARKALQARIALYKSRAEEKLPILQEIDPDGSLSLRQISRELNQRSVPTISGKGTWSANSVRRLISKSGYSNLILLRR